MAIDTIKTSAILDGAVGTADINDAAVTTAKIADANITTLKILDGNVTSAKLDTNITVSGDLTVDTNTLFVDSTNNRVGIGTISPNNALEVVGAISGNGGYIDTGDDSANTQSVFKAHRAGVGIETGNFIRIRSVGDGAGNATQMIFDTNSVEAMRIDGSGNIGIGENTPSEKLEIIQGAGTTTRVVVGGGTAAMLVINGDRDNSGDSADPDASLLFTSDGAYNYSVQPLGLFGYRISHLNGSAASQLAFADIKSGVEYERMRLDTVGNLLVGKTSSNTGVDGVEAQVSGILAASVSGGPVLVVNRNTNDGQIVAIRQAGTTEGTISVSGTTVTFNGGHLGRWSQLADNTRDDTLLKGTVLTNLDQMASWLVDAVEATYYTEDDELPDGVSVGDEKTPAVTEHYQDNEQLNCMAKSSVEGDPNVAGVFVNWDNDDDEYTNDMNIAMTGDMIIRIAQGTTVSRGDLLMSAGDGTAKPQEDDIVRAKTIAKVTSTNVTCTYDDGSYCVPCVLMAC